MFITPLIERELEGLDGFELVRAANLEVRAPSKEALARVRQGAAETGDDARLSEADIEVLALALELGLPVLTDDYSIQNLAEHLDIVHVPVGERGIRRKVRWTYRCKGCGRYFEERTDECPVCGSMVRSSRRRK